MPQCPMSQPLCTNNLCKNNDLSSTGIIEFLQKCKLKGIEIDIANTRVVLLRSNPTMSDSDYDGTDDMLDDTCRVLCCILG